MPRTSDWFLDCVFYIYNSEIAANENDERAGGSGFLVAKRRPDNPSIFRIFGVTAAHVIRKAETPFLRFNKRFEDGVRVLEVPKVKWTQHPDGDDISIAPLEISPTTFRTLCIEPERFVTETVLKEEDIGIGDDVFMVGRFIHHSGGSAQNIPSVRFGNIAMMNRQRIVRDDGLLQETFLVESRSVPGYSGSPVFVYKREFQEHKRVNPFQVQSQGFWLLGIDWCHLNDSVRVTEKPDNKEVLTPYSVRMNSGMAGVIPAWKILDVLDSEEFM